MLGGGTLAWTNQAPPSSCCSLSHSSTSSHSLINNDLECENPHPSQFPPCRLNRCGLPCSSSPHGRANRPDPSALPRSPSPSSTQTQRLTTTDNSRQAAMSSLLAAGAPASQAVRAVLLPASAAVASGIRPSIPPCSSTGGSPSPCPRPSQPRRQYAMRAPSLTRKDRALRNPSPLARFEASDVPAVGLWENWERTVGELGGLTPAEAREVAVAFCQFTQTEGPVSAWERGKGMTGPKRLSFFPGARG